MPNKTTNYNLNKPTMNENVDISVLNENMDIIDAELNRRALKPTVITGTLSTGNTSITLSSDAITTNSVIDVYTSIYGVNPIETIVETGNITLTFDAQSSDVAVRVEVR